MRQRRGMILSSKLIKQRSRSYMAFLAFRYSLKICYLTLFQQFPVNSQGNDLTYIENRNILPLKLEVNPLNGLFPPKLWICYPTSTSWNS